MKNLIGYIFCTALIIPVATAVITSLSMAIAVGAGYSINPQKIAAVVAVVIACFLYLIPLMDWLIEADAKRQHRKKFEPVTEHTHCIRFPIPTKTAPPAAVPGSLNFRSARVFGSSPKPPNWLHSSAAESSLDADGCAPESMIELPRKDQAACCALQCKDIPDRPILEMLSKNPTQWHNWCWTEWNVRTAMPPSVPSKLALAKMRMMIRRGVVDGCPCGCRGDFVITEKGIAEISSQPVAQPRKDRE